MPAHYVFSALNRVLAQAGTSMEQAVESQLYEPDLNTFHGIDTLWLRYMPVATAALVDGHPIRIFDTARLGAPRRGR
jgi:hypothetical protein